MLEKAEQRKGCLKLQDSYGIYMIRAVADDVIRCVYTVLDEVKEESGLAEEQKTEPERCDFEEYPEKWVLLTKNLCVEIDRENGHITYSGRNGKILLREAGREAEKKKIIEYTTNGEPPVIERVKTIDGERNFIKNLQAKPAGEASKAKIHFDLMPDEKIYGFGQAEEDVCRRSRGKKAETVCLCGR